MQAKLNVIASDDPNEEILDSNECAKLIGFEDCNELTAV